MKFGFAAAPIASSAPIAPAVGLVLVVMMATTLDAMPTRPDVRLGAQGAPSGSRAPSAPGSPSAGATLPPGTPRGLQPHRVQPAAEGSLVTPQDTINGDPLSDPRLIERIERVAASLPPELLVLQPRSPTVRYVAQAFGGSDEAPVFSAVFKDPAAALAFGCAMEEEPTYPCELVPATAAPQPYEEIPGLRCVPLRLAVGAAAFEPDRCEASG